MSGRLAKRWGRWFVFVWIAVSVTTALLPCREVLAAVAANQAGLHDVCGQPQNQAPDSGGGRKSKACVNLGVPARVPTERLLAPSSGSLVHPVSAILASTGIPLVHTGASPAPPYRAAPTAVAVYLRSSRLLI